MSLYIISADVAPSHLIPSISPHLVYFISSCLFHLIGVFQLIVSISSHFVYFRHVNLSIYLTYIFVYFRHVILSISPRLVYFTSSCPFQARADWRSFVPPRRNEHVSGGARAAPTVVVLYRRHPARTNEGDGDGGSRPSAQPRGLDRYDADVRSTDLPPRIGVGSDRSGLQLRGPISLPASVPAVRSSFVRAKDGGTSFPVANKLG